MPSRQPVPAAVTRRPTQPLRPLPARRVGGDVLALRARRRRYQRVLPPRAGERGW